MVFLVPGRIVREVQTGQQGVAKAAPGGKGQDLDIDDVMIRDRDI